MVYIQENLTNVRLNRPIISASNLGVSFINGYRTDDYKSRIHDLMSKKGLKKEELVWPIRNLNFTAFEGEILGIIGRNGSGKTTLCKVISNIIQPDEGSILVEGRVTALYSFGMAFQKELTGRENIYLNGMMLGINKNKINNIIEDIQEFSGIGSFIDQPIKYYSSGMRSRLGFSTAAMIEPEILIIDEALNTGDIEFSEKAAIKMKELVHKAKLVILITHNINYAKDICHRILWLEEGNIKADGEPLTVLEDYQATLPETRPKKRKLLELNETKKQFHNKTVVEIQDISLTFKHKNLVHQALKNVSLNINEGEIVGIIGKNGAGKSTLCKVLTQILKPDSGEVLVKGKTSSLLSYGTGFNSQLSGKDNIFLNGMLLGISKQRIEKKYNEIVSFSELDKSIDNPVKQYSSGMKARLGFSVAATIKPDIFVIDEALSTGDISFQQKASSKIQELIESAKAVIVVSHNMNVVKKVCTRAIWLDGGIIKADGDPKDVIKQYKKAVKAKKKRDKN